MKSFTSAYQAYEHRVMRGEFTSSANKDLKPTGEREALLAQLGEMLIQTGLKLKQNHSIHKTIAWSSSGGSKP